MFQKVTGIAGVQRAIDRIKALETAVISMILKDSPDPPRSNHPWDLSGYQAERQMAFHLKRAFETVPEIKVLNGVRLKHEEDCAQYDHLILHPHGIVIVESKSVSSEIRVNNRGEWSRKHHGEWHGMPSPIQQAKAQAQFLRSYLQPHSPMMLGRQFGIQPDFTRTPIDILVAVSDSGIIQRPSNHQFDEVCKADQIADKVRDLVRHYQNLNMSSRSLGDRTYVFRNTELAAIGYFLLKHHEPFQQKEIEPAQPSSAAEPIRSGTEPVQSKHLPQKRERFQPAKPQLRRSLVHSSRPAVVRPKTKIGAIGQPARSTDSRAPLLKRTLVKSSAIRKPQRNNLSLTPPSKPQPFNRNSSVQKPDKKLNATEVQQVAHLVNRFIKGELTYRPGAISGRYRVEPGGQNTFTLRDNQTNDPILHLSRGNVILSELKQSDLLYLQQALVPAPNQKRSIAPPAKLRDLECDR